MHSFCFKLISDIRFVSISMLSNFLLYKKIADQPKFDLLIDPLFVTFWACAITPLPNIFDVKIWT